MNSDTEFYIGVGLFIISYIACSYFMIQTFAAKLPTTYHIMETETWN